MDGNSINVKMIEKFLKENNLSIAKFCKLCGICVSTYKRVISNKNYKINTIFKISRGLGVYIYQMYT